MTMMSNNNMIKRLLASILLAAAGIANTASDGVAWDRFPTEKLADRLQRILANADAVLDGTEVADEPAKRSPRRRRQSV